MGCLIETLPIHAEEIWETCALNGFFLDDTGEEPPLELRIRMVGTHRGPSAQPLPPARGCSKVVEILGFPVMISTTGASFIVPCRRRLTVCWGTGAWHRTSSSEDESAARPRTRPRMRMAHGLL